MVVMTRPNMVKNVVKNAYVSMASRQMLASSNPLNHLPVGPHYPPLDNTQVMVIVWRLRRNIFRTVL